jgi:hypothetical protein
LIHPAYLTFALRQAGFSDVAVDWPVQDPSDPVFDRVEGIRLQLFSPQGFVVIATR